jgi:hypothetical protein
MPSVRNRLPNRLPNLSRLGPKKNKKGAAPKPVGERADPLKANVRFHKLQMAAHAKYGLPLEAFAAFRTRFYPDNLRMASQVTGWEQLDAHEARWAAFEKGRRGQETFKEFLDRVH